MALSESSDSVTEAPGALVYDALLDLHGLDL